MKCKQLKNIIIKKETYNSDGERKITCTLTCKINLNEFERQHIMFTDSFIHRKLGQYIPVIKTVYKPSSDGSFGSDIAAKYYIVDGKAKVLYFDNNYYNYERNYGNSKYYGKNYYSYMPGDILPVSMILKPCMKKGEHSEHKYIDTFIVKGNAVCCKDDTFDENTGKNIALAHALFKANIKVDGILSLILDECENVSSMIRKTMDELNDRNVELFKAFNLNL